MEHFKSDLVACTRREDVSEIVGKCTFKNKYTQRLCLCMKINIHSVSACGQAHHFQTRMAQEVKSAETYRNWVFTINNYCTQFSSLSLCMRDEDNSSSSE